MPPSPCASSATPRASTPKPAPGKSTDFTGISAPYEPPPSPELELRTDQLTVSESVAKILEFLHIQDAATAISI